MLEVGAIQSMRLLMPSGNDLFVLPPLTISNCAFTRLARSVFDEAENVGLSLKLLDIGGGFPGISTVTSTLYDSSDSESEDYGRGMASTKQQN